jgi:hypothetical protein
VTMTARLVCGTTCTMAVSVATNGNGASTAS